MVLPLLPCSLKTWSSQLAMLHCHGSPWLWIQQRFPPFKFVWKTLSEVDREHKYELRQETQLAVKEISQTVFYTTTGYSLKAAWGWDTNYQSQHDASTRQHGRSHAAQHDSSTTNKLTDILKHCISCGRFPNLPQYVMRHQVLVTAFLFMNISFSKTYFLLKSWKNMQKGNSTYKRQSDL